jgi:surface antigen
MQAGRVTVTPSELMKLSVDLDNTQRAINAPVRPLYAGDVGSGAVASALATFAGNWDYHRRALAERMHSLSQAVSKAAEDYSEAERRLQEAMDHGHGGGGLDPVPWYMPREPLDLKVPSKLEPARLLLAEPEADLESRFVADGKPVGNGYDRWNFLYNASGNCTSYAAWRLNDLAAQQGLGSNYFSNNKLGSVTELKFGNADHWNVQAAKIGPAADQTPQPGAVAWWGPDSMYGSLGGHVAVVRSINADGSITVEESGWGSYVFKVETIKPGTPGFPTGFLHLLPNT